MMKVEVQIRTLAMDTWASQEHQIRYKKDSGATDRSFGEELLQCADMCARVDEIMDTVHHPDRVASQGQDAQSRKAITKTYLKPCQQLRGKA